MSITFSPNPIPVLIKETNQEGYILYVNDSGMFENDCFCCVIKETGELIHLHTKQFTVEKNYTWGINVKQ